MTGTPCNYVTVTPGWFFWRPTIPGAPTRRNGAHQQLSIIAHCGGAVRPFGSAADDRAKLAAIRPPPILGGCGCSGRVPHRARRLVSARIMPLRLEAFEQLPKHARRCVFWEVDPATLGNEDHLADPEFEKEAWLSMVMLEWGSCGQIATAVARTSDAKPDRPRAWATCSTPRRGRCRGHSGFPTAPGVRGRGAVDVDGHRARADGRRPAARLDRPGHR